MRISTVLFFTVAVSLIKESRSSNIIRNNTDNFYRLVYTKPGNITIIGLFDGFSGTDCGLQPYKVLEEMASAIWTVEALSQNEFLSGITIGLSVYEICQENHLNKSIEFLNFLKKIFEQDNNLGILTTLKFEKMEKSGENAYSNFIEVQHILNDDTLVELTVQLLANLQWTTVSFIYAENQEVLNIFTQRATNEGICVYNRILGNQELPSEAFETSEEQLGTIIFITEFKIFSQIVKRENIQNGSQRIIFVPTDLFFNPIGEFPEDLIVILPSAGDKKILTQFVHGNGYHKDFFNHREPTKSPLFVGISASILKLLSPLKQIHNERCKSGQKYKCAEVIIDFVKHLKKNVTVSKAEDSTKLSPEDVENVLGALKLDQNYNVEMFLYLASLISANKSEDAAIFQLYNAKEKKFHPVLLKINDNLFSNGGIANDSGKRIADGDLKEVQTFSKETNAENSLIGALQRPMGGSFGNLKKAPRKYNQHAAAVYHSSQNESTDKSNLHFNFGNGSFCSNLKENNLVTLRKNASSIRIFKWRSLTWVNVNSCFGLFGLLCTILILLFIIRIFCNSDSIEGSICFTVLWMVSVILIFISSFAYHVEPSAGPVKDTVCNFQRNGPALCYAVLLALMLSRSLLIASIERRDDSFCDINEYLQSILFLFILAVQISFSLHRFLLEENNCLEEVSENKMVTSLIYDFLLLGLLLGLSCFTARSRKNHREGLLLTLSTIFIALSWLAWLCFYYHLSWEYKNAAVAIGLNATGFAVLICAFLPKVYLMFKEHNSMSLFLSSVGRNILQSKNYKSNQAICDLRLENFVGQTAFSNPNFYPSKGNENDARNDRQKFREDSMVEVSLNHN